MVGERLAERSLEDRVKERDRCTPIEELLYEPEHSLIDQSLHSKLGESVRFSV